MPCHHVLTKWKCRAVLSKLLPEQILQELLDANVLVSVEEDRYRAQIRISNLYMPQIVQGLNKADDLFYVHSAYPTTSESVFFGPDTYLYLDFISNAKTYLVQPPRAVADVCCGSGAGAIHAARLFPCGHVFGLDLNTQALCMGGINAASAKVKIDFLKSNLFEGLKGKSSRPEIDLIVSNPPYIASAPEGTDGLPVYADGGAQEGLELSIRIVEEGKTLLAEGGVIMIYTGVAISIDRPAIDDFLSFLKQVPELDLLEYRVIHPDMWSEDIGRGTYSNTGRIQVVGAVLRKNSSTA